MSASGQTSGDHLINETWPCMHESLHVYKLLDAYNYVTSGHVERKDT